jgi:hypothetical protein
MVEPALRVGAHRQAFGLQYGHYLLRSLG